MSSLFFFRRVSLCLILASSPLLHAGQKSVVIPLISVSDWRLVDSVKVAPQDLARFEDNLPVDYEFGVKSAMERTYQLNGLKATAVLEEAADPSSAYGLYTFYQNEGMRSAPGIQMAMIGSHNALMTRGRYFIHILGNPGSKLSADDFRSLLTIIGGTRLSSQNIESLPAPLPKQGLIPGTERYALGIETAKRVLGSFPAGLIGFQDGVEVQTGAYRIGPDRLNLIVISYPTPQLAQLRFGAMQHVLQINQRRGPGAVFGLRQGSYALLALNAQTKASANRLLGQLKVTESVSWNARYRSQSAFTLQVLELVIANLELVLVIAGFAFLGGITIFLGKKLIMKLFPNSPWPRSDEEELIRLKLS